MTAERLAEENGRLVERERLDIAPTRVLGLFVVGRLARRHSLAVQLVETPDGGVTAQVAIPAALHNRAHAPQVAPAPAGTAEPVVAPHRGLPAELVIPPARHSDGFTWFVTARTRSARSTCQSRHADLPRSDPDESRRPTATRAGCAAGGDCLSPGSGSTAAPTLARCRSDTGRAGWLPIGDRGRNRRRPDPASGGRPDSASGSRPADPPGRGVVSPGTGRESRPCPARRQWAQPARARAAAGVPIRDPDAELAAFDAFSAGLARADLTADPTGLASPPIPTQTYRTPVPHPRARHADVHDVEPTNGRHA